MAYSKYNRARFMGDKPVKEGETYDIEIEGVGTKGDGIGKIKGFVVIVPGVKAGDKVKVKVNAVRGKVAFGDAVGKAASEPSEEEEQAGAEEDSGEEDAEEASEGDEDISEDSGEDVEGGQEE